MHEQISQVAPVDKLSVVLAILIFGEKISAIQLLAIILIAAGDSERELSCEVVSANDR